MHRIMCVVFATVALAIGGCSGGGSSSESTPAQPALQLVSGKLDPAYGAGGKAVVEQGSGRIAVDSAGTAYVGGAVFTRLDSDGRPKAFAESFRGFSPVLDGVGNIYVIDGYGVVKRDADGRLIPAFGSNGRVTLFTPQSEFPAMEYPPYFQRLLPNRTGGVDVLGLTDGPHYSGGYVFMVGLDRDGVAPVTKGLSARSAPIFLLGPEVAVDSAGNYFLAGTIAPSSFGPAVIKTNVSGALDPGFGAAGIWVPPACVTRVDAVAMDAFDNVFVGATCAGQAAVFKLDARGVPDNLFGAAGMATTLPGAGGEVHAILVPASGAVYALGVVESQSGCGQAAVGKLTPKGVADLSFGTNGSERLGVLADELTPATLAMDASGRLYAGVNTLSTCPFVNATPRQVVVARLGG